MPDLPFFKFSEDQLGLVDHRVVGEEDYRQEASQPDSIPRLIELALRETKSEAPWLAGRVSSRVRHYDLVQAVGVKLGGGT